MKFGAPIAVLPGSTPANDLRVEVETLRAQVKAREAGIEYLKQQLEKRKGFDASAGTEIFLRYVAQGQRRLSDYFSRKVGACLPAGWLDAKERPLRDTRVHPIVDLADYMRERLRPYVDGPTAFITPAQYFELEAIAKQADQQLQQMVQMARDQGVYLDPDSKKPKPLNTAENVSNVLTLYGRFKVENINKLNAALDRLLLEPTPAERQERETYCRTTQVQSGTCPAPVCSRGLFGACNPKDPFGPCTVSVQDRLPFL